MGRLIACVALLAGLASPASACINDDELPTHEREFRSQYRGPANLASTPSTNPYGSWLLLGTGTALLTGAVAVTLFGGRARN